MVLKSFYINVFIRVTLIMISSVAFGIIVQSLEHGYYYTLVGMITLIIIQALLLMNQVNRTNSDLEKFFSSVQDKDTSITFPGKFNDRPFSGLRNKLNDLNSVIQSIKIQNEKDRLFLQAVVDHVDIGLLSINQQGVIEICNKAAKELVRINQGEKITSLKSKNEELYRALDQIRPGHDILVRFKINSQLKSILIKSIEIKTEEQVVKLISFEDITRELDKKELESWQRLIRVLTHEIMNSISPVTSLTSVISGYFKNKETNRPLSPDSLNNDIVQKTLEGLATIEETGKGLLDFVNKYRKLTSLPVPKHTKFKVESLLDKCSLLMGSTISDRIVIRNQVNPPNLELSADLAQIELVMINLIKNAAESMSSAEQGVIKLNAFTESDSVIIEVEDSGPGMEAEVQENIFIPFFTTKKNGSGIGLSISRQIMRNHNGAISVVSELGKGSIFTLSFPIILV